MSPSPEIRTSAAVPGDAMLREGVLALVRWQCSVPAEGLAPLDDAVLRAELALFPAGCVQQAFGINWTEAQQRAWAQVCDRLVASASAQPQLAVHGDWTPQRLPALLQEAAGPGAGGRQAARLGPVTYDLASLLRSADLDADEAQQLDLGVRWWQQARRDGVPLGDTLAEDFGECWRALEWMGLLLQLAELARLGHAGAPDAGRTGRLLHDATRVAMRYAPLKPLLTLLAPMSGQRVDRGFTF
jgi:hypothetical protein